jgi:hypothetical protein
MQWILVNLSYFFHAMWTKGCYDERVNRLPVDECQLTRHLFVTRYVEYANTMQHTNDADHTDRIIAQGRTLVWAIGALGEIQSSWSFERELAELFQAACERCLSAIVAEAPPWVREEILDVGKCIHDERPVERLDGSDEQATPLSQAWATGANGATSDLEPDQAGGGGDELPSPPGFWTHATDPERASGRQYHTPTLTKRERARKTRTLPI